MEFTKKEKYEYFEKEELKEEVVQKFLKKAERLKTNEDQIQLFAQSAVELYELENDLK